MTTTRINTSAYPLGMDTDKSIPHVIDEITEIKAINFNVLKDAILSIENALGINPQGDYDTVVDRLDAISDDFIDIYLSGIGDTIVGPTDNEDANTETDIGISVGMKMLYDEDGEGTKAARLVFGDSCNCNIVLDDRASASGTFDNPTTTTKWIPTADEIIEFGAQPVVPLSILGNSAYGGGALLLGIASRRIRVFDDLSVSRSLRVKNFIRASNVDLSMDGLHYAGLKSKIARKAIVFSADLSQDDYFGMTTGHEIDYVTVSIRDKNRTPASLAPSNISGLRRIIPTQPLVFSSGNLSIDGDIEIQGELFISDYMNVKAAQTSVNIDKVRVVVPTAEFKTNVLMVTFSAIILDVTNNNSRGGIYLKINDKKIDHPMIYKGQKLTEDDPYDELANEGIQVFPDEFYDEPVVTDTVLGGTRNRLEISPNGSYTGMSTVMMLSDTKISGVALDGTVPRFNPNEDLVITMGATEGISSIMYTVVVWATGATNVEVISGWNPDGSAIKESWTPVM